MLQMKHSTKATADQIMFIVSVHTQYLNKHGNNENETLGAKHSAMNEQRDPFSDFSVGFVY